MTSPISDEDNIECVLFHLCYCPSLTLFYCIRMQPSPTKRIASPTKVHFETKPLKSAMKKREVVVPKYVDYIYIIINKPFIYVVDRENMEWSDDDNDDVFTYVLCSFDIKFINQCIYLHPELLLKQNHPRTTG